MKINLGAASGFCFGVNRAVDYLINAAGTKNIVTLGPIIHNKAVVGDLIKKGIVPIEDVFDVPPGYEVAIRTHGVGKNIIDFLNDNGTPYIDLTCPFVKKIHNIVYKHHHDGYIVVIVGDKDHPEVRGINGWCGDSAVVAKQISDLDGKIMAHDKVCMVSQTTMDRETFKKIENFLKNHCQSIVIFDTICNATNERQIEAERISKESDIMFVIGGKSSANTNKLTELCSKYCETYQIENFEGIPWNIDIPNKKIGITAGASTPSWIIKEAISAMEEFITNGNENFAKEFEEYEKSLITLNTGDIVNGTVIRVNDNGISVNLGYKSDGFVPAAEVTDDPDMDISTLYKEGDAIEVFVVRVNDVEGEVTLSKKKIDAMKSFKLVESAFETKEILEGKIIQAVNGGVIASVNGARVFIPASLASDRYLTDLSVLVGNTVNFRIVDIKRIRNRTKVVGSIKEVLKERNAVLAGDFWDSVEVGKQYSGKVKSLTNFGAFVDIGGVDGLIHISEMSWSKIKHPSDILSEGDVVDVYILNFNKEKGKVSLGFKKAQDNPWAKAKEELSVGDAVDCKIIRIVPFGAFAQIYPGVDGLIHISQVADRRIGKVEDELVIGQHVQAKIIELDFEKQKIGLSIRALKEENEKKELEEILEEDRAATEAQATEDAELEMQDDEVAIEAEAEEVTSDEAQSTQE